ncbi:uncharacterized protein METZ01_LOCUS267696, partial [marine metagenome]
VSATIALRIKTIVRILKLSKSGYIIDLV